MSNRPNADSRRTFQQTLSPTHRASLDACSAQRRPPPTHSASATKYAQDFSHPGQCFFCHGSWPGKLLQCPAKMAGPSPGHRHPFRAARSSPHAPPMRTEFRSHRGLQCSAPSRRPVFRLTADWLLAYSLTCEIRFAFFKKMLDTFLEVMGPSAQGDFSVRCVCRLSKGLVAGLQQLLFDNAHRAGRA